ncbi:MAG: baseplate J/gp47 family protein, partial [Candidatus Bilamarchaeaceae archaeon]
MALPQFKTYQQILNALIQQFVSETGVNDLNKGSVLRSFLEAVALSDYKVQTDIIAALASVDIDRATGFDLDLIGAAKGVARRPAQSASGSVTIFQKGIQKKATKIYQGTAAPPAGSVTINVANAEGFPSSGSIYIGRGTANLEGPIAYTAITNLGNYYQITLSTPTTKNHNTGESIILAQGGNRVIPAGTIVQTRASITASSIQFRVLNSVILLDGEEELKNVPVVALQAGSSGNVPAQAIVEFASDPFPNAGVTNPLAFVSGRDIMLDDEYRDLIKKSEQAKTKATPLAIIQAAVGTTSNDDKKTVTSAEIKQPASREEPGILYIDDSTGYQPIFDGQGFEPVIDNAYGGEIYLQLQKEDIVKATVVTSLEAPFSLAGGMKLAVRVGGKLYEHIFAADDFSVANAADTWEVVNSINANTNLGFFARSVSNSKKIALFAKSFKNEDIEVIVPSSGIDANQFLGFPSTKAYSVRLYKNDQLLIKDGVVPTIYSKPQSLWANSITNGATLKVKVDQTGFQTITINNADFVPYGFATVNKNNTLESWAKVLTNKIAGVTVTVEGSRLKMVSNRGADNDAYLEISSDVPSNSLAQADNMWQAGEKSVGRASDYALNRSTGQVQLSVPLSAGDQITAGTKFSRGFIDSGEFTTGTVTLNTTPSPRLFFIVDAEASRVNVSLSSALTVSVTNPTTNVWRYTFSSSGVISGVAKDHWVIVTDNSTLAANNTGFWRVHDVDTAGAWFEVIKTAGTTQSGITLTSANDFIFIDSPKGEMQTTTLPTGVQTLSALATHINANIKNVTAEVFQGKKIRVSTLSYNNKIGSIFLAGYNTTAGVLGFIIADYDTSEVSHTAYNTSAVENTFLEFIHDSVATGDSSLPYTNITTTTNLDTAGYEPNNRLVFLNPLNANISSNRKLSADIEQITGTNVILRNNTKLNEIISNDRYYIAVPFNFTHQDNMVAIIDGDLTGKTFNVKMGRRGRVYASTTSTAFQAYDIDLSPTGNWPSSFGDNFNFADFKVHFKARAILDPNGINNKIMVKAADPGPAGNEIRVGIFYPENPSSALSHSVTVGERTLINLILASGPLRTGGSWDATTEFDVTNPSLNTYRYTYNGTGTAPNFLSAGIVVGDIVSISSNSAFAAANRGVFKVTAITNTYFEVKNYTPGVVESNIQLNNTSFLQFYPLLATTTAAALGAYVNSTPSISQYITISQLESGSGVINTSTWDDSAGSQLRQPLVDGENWILSSNIGTNSTPNNIFNLKRPLTIFGPDLLNEEFFIIPTRADHLNRYLNRFAVTGLGSVSKITLARDAKAIQLASELFGSAGTIFVTGGTAVDTSAAILDPGAVIDSNYTIIGIPSSASKGFEKGQWVKVSNSEKLNKDTAFKSTTQITWDSQNPVVGKTTITIPNSTAANIQQNGYFWTRRWHDADNTTEIRLEKHHEFMALIWTGTGTAPAFRRVLNITNRDRSSNISTITLSAPHGIPLNRAVWITVAGVTPDSFNGTFRAIADTATTLQYRQDGLPNVTSAATSGTATRRVAPGDRVVLSGAFNALNHGEYMVVGTFEDNTI